ncbi:WD repeat-containing protein 11 [Nymphon striatum]|nr:WD repeat-containing protein 11 [Nymphon striatum]
MLPDNMPSDEKKSNMSVPYKISPRTLTGGLGPNNKNAIDWGWQSLVAYGCFNIVVVADANTLQNVQTLEKHRAHITKIKWSRENYYHDLHKPYMMKLASADATGHIVIWDVNMSVHSAVFSDGNKPVLDMEWLHNQDSCQDLLLALHQPYSLILWNAMTGTKVWKKNYTENLISFSFDPFESNNIAFLANDCILFINDFSPNKVPSSNGRKFFISSSSGSNSTSMTNLTSIDRDNSFEESKSKGRSLRSHLSKILVGVDVKPKSEDKFTLNECLQLAFHNACRYHLLLVYAREVLILDLEIHQTVGIITVDKNGSPFNQVMSCCQRDILYCLHENGGVSVRVRKKANYYDFQSPDLHQAPDTISLSSTDTYVEVGYDLRSQSDSMRTTKHSKIMGFAVCPISEKKIVLVTNDGRIILLSLEVFQNIKQNSMLSPLHSPNLDSFVNFKFPTNKDVHSSVLPLENVQPHPRLCLADEIAPCLYANQSKSGKSVLFKLLISGLIPSLSFPPLIIKMCPPLTTKNLKVYRPLLAIGNSMGTIQIVNLSTGVIEREFSVHIGPVRYANNVIANRVKVGIEWAGLSSIISYSFPNVANQSGNVRNEVIWTDILTGRPKIIRTEKSDESPIEMLKVSCLKQYFIITFKEQAFELWDLKNMSVLRTMPKRFPNISALEWSPVHNVKSLKKKISKSDETDKDVFKENRDALKNIPDSSRSVSSSEHNPFLKEQFVFTDTDGQLYHFSVEGSVIKDGTKLPPDGNMKSVTSIAWKGDQIVLGDVDGNLNLWDLSGKVSRSVPTHRGWIKKIKFAPGRGVMRLLVLYSDGIDVWDARDVELIDKIKTPKELARIHDSDWAGSDKLILVTADGCIRITAVNSHVCSSPIHEYSFEEHFFVPHMLQPKMSLNIRSILFHHPWTLTSYNLQDHSKHSPSHDSCDDSVDQNQLLKDLFWDQPLDLYYDILCDPSTYLKCQLDRLALHDNKRSTYEQTSKCVKDLLLLGQTDRAVQLLLETDSENKNYYTDCLRACLAATVCSSETSQSTIKLVATHLISNNFIREGVELLCLIKKSSDACRYLQSSGKWNYAIWLAKARMSHNECLEVLKRYVDYLCTPEINQKSKAVLVLLSLGQFEKVLELLYSMKMFERAVLFVESCLEFGHFQQSYIQYILLTAYLLHQDAFLRWQMAIAQFDIVCIYKLRFLNQSVPPLIEALYLDYARYLYSLDNKKAALYYCDQVKGTQLRKEIEILESDK